MWPKEPRQHLLLKLVCVRHAAAPQALLGEASAHRATPANNPFCMTFAADARSLLQCLFMNKSFLKGVYEWEPAAVGGAAAAPTNDATAHMKTLQRVFGRMQASARRFCDPKEFAEQLGVGAQQQDAQEFNSLLMSMLDNLLKLSDKDELKNHVPNLFRGKASYVTTCQNCKTESRRTNDFYELELPIESAMRKRAHDSVEECLRTYSSTVETLEGDNQYFCDRCNAKHDAQRSVVVDETPAYLTLQLMRFSYDRAKCAKTKVKHSVHCTPTLALAADKFKLVAVMYHKGTGASGGHYTAEIKCPPSLSSCKEEWWKFDDETVTHIGAAGSQKPADQTAQAALGAATPQSVDLTGCDSDQEVETDEQERTPAGSHKTPSKKGKGKKSAVSAKQAVPQTPENKTSGSANAYMLIYQKCKRGASTLETLGESTGAATVNAALPAWLEAEIEAENMAFQLQLDQERDQTQRLREAIASRKRSHAAFVGTSESHVEDFGKDSEHWLRTDWLRHWVTGEHRQADAAGASSTHDLTAEDNTPSADVAAPTLFSTTPDTLGNLCQHKKLDPRRVASGDFKRVPLDRFKQMHQEMRKEFGWPERYEIVHTCDDCEEAFKQESTEQNAERAQWTELLSDIDKSQQDGRGSTCGQFCLSKGWLKELRKRVSGNKPRVRGTLFDSFAVQGEAGAAGSLKLVNNDIKCECAKDREMEGEKARLVPDSKRQYHFVPEEVWRAIVDRFPEACELRLDDECALCKAKKDETQSAKSERVQTRDGAIAQLAELHKRPTSKHSSRWYPPTHTDVLSDRRLVGEFYVLPADWLAKWRALMRTSDEITLSLPPMPRCECGGSLPAPSLLAALNAVGQAQAADMDGKVDDVELVAKEDWDTLAKTCAGDTGAEQRPCLLIVRSPGSDGWECEPKACPGCIQKREKELEEKNRKFENCPVRVHVLKAKVRCARSPPLVPICSRPHAPYKPPPRPCCWSRAGRCPRDQRCCPARSVPASPEAHDTKQRSSPDGVAVLHRYRDVRQAEGPPACRLPRLLRSLALHA